MPLPTMRSAPSSATRGGYGSNYLLDGLDLDLIAESAKPLIGYSDLTALHLWLLDQIQLPAFHGPMLSADFSREDGVHLPSLQAALSGQLYSVGAAEGLRTLHRGQRKRHALRRLPQHSGRSAGHAL